MPCSSAQTACLPGLLGPSRLRQGMKCIKTWMWKVGEAIQLKEGENTKSCGTKVESGTEKRERSHSESEVTAWTLTQILYMVSDNLIWPCCSVVFLSFHSLWVHDDHRDLLLALRAVVWRDGARSFNAALKWRQARGQTSQGPLLWFSKMYMLIQQRWRES